MVRKFVKVQRLGERIFENGSRRYDSPYWNYLKGYEEEPPLANPDSLLDLQENQFWPDRFNSNEKEILNELKKVNLSKILTEREREYLKLFVEEGKTSREIMEITGLSKQRISKLEKQVSTKIKKYLELD